MRKVPLLLLGLSPIVCLAQNIGIGTASPNNAALLHVDIGTSNSKGLLVTGTYDFAATMPNLGAGSRLMFYPGKSAFRAGYVDGTQWDNANVGFSSVAFGLNTRATNSQATAFGINSLASGANSTAMGVSTLAGGNTSTALGYGTIALGYASTVLGMYNHPVSGTDENSIGALTPLFLVGNGDDDANRRNALAVLKNGNIGIGIDAPTGKLQIKYQSNSGTSPHLLLEETSGSYTRLAFKNATTPNYWTIGGLPQANKDNAKLTFYYDGLGDDVMKLIGNGSVEIGNNSGFFGSKLYVVNASLNNANAIVAEASGASPDYNAAIYARGRNSVTTNTGVYAYAEGGINAFSVYAGDPFSGVNKYAGYFAGNTHVNGTFSKSAGTFKIDHPMDPANKYLVHSFVESPDMMNVYNGNIVTDVNGDAIVQLPSYFEAENIDFKYQLTVIGQFAQAIVLKEVEGNRFAIKTDRPNVKVSWQVTGVRNDEYAKKNRVVPEVDKGVNKGKYMHPELYGEAKEKGINYMDPKTEKTKL